MLDAEQAGEGGFNDGHSSSFGTRSVSGASCSLGGLIRQSQPLGEELDQARNRAEAKPTLWSSDFCSMFGLYGGVGPFKCGRK